MSRYKLKIEYEGTRYSGRQMQKLTAPPSGIFLEKVYYKKEDIIFDTRPVINI